MKNFQTELDVTILAKLVSQRDHSFANVAIAYNNEYTTGQDVYEGYGNSSRDKEDKPNLEIGELLALSRALENLSAKIRKRANGLVKNVDNERAHKKLLKEQKELAAKEAAKPKKKPAKKVAKKK